MFKFNGNKAKFLSVFLVFAMILSFFTPFMQTSKAASYEEMKTDENKQVITLPLIEKPKEYDKNILSTREKTTVTEAVYEVVYDENYITVSFDTPVDYGFMGEVPVTLEMYTSSSDILSQFTYNVILEKDGVSYSVSESNTDKFRRVELYGGTYILAYFPSDLTSGIYNVKVQAYNGDNKVFETQPVDIELNCKGPWLNEDVFSVNADKLYIDINDLGIDISLYPDSKIKVVDSQGSTVFTSYNEFEEIHMNSWSESIWPFDDRYEYFDVWTDLYRVAQVTEGQYNLVMEFNNETIELGNVTFTDNATIDEIGVSDYVLAGDRNFDIIVWGRNIPNKDALQIAIVDQMGETVALSTDSKYIYYDEEEGDIDCLYNMEVLSGKELIDGEIYSVQITYTGEGTIENLAEGAYITTLTEADIIDVDTSFAALGKITLQTVNLESNATYRAKLFDTSSYQDILIGEAEGIADENGKITFEFTQNGQPINISDGDYEIELFQGTNYITYAWFYIDSEYGSVPEIVDTEPTLLPIDVTSFNAELVVESLYPDIDAIDVKLVEKDNHSNVVGQMVKDTITLEKGEWREYYIYGNVEVTGTLEKGKFYVYVVNNNGNMVISDELVAATDFVSANSTEIAESVERRVGYEYQDMLGSNHQQLNFAVNGVINVTNDQNVDFYLKDTNGNKIATLQRDTLNITTNYNIFKDYEGILNIQQPLQLGYYYLVGEYEGQIFIEDEYYVTDKPELGYTWIDRKVSTNTSAIRLGLGEMVNIDLQNLQFKMKDLSGNVVNTEIDVNSIDTWNYGKSGSLYININSPLTEGYYEYELSYDGIVLENLDGYFMKEYDRSIYATTRPMLEHSTGIYFDENDNVEKYIIRAINLDPNKTYKGLFYLESDDEQGIRYVDTIQLPTPDENSDFIIPIEMVSHLPVGDYDLYIEMDNILLGRNWFEMYQSSETIEIANPSFTISGGQYYTNNPVVILNIDPDGYDLMRVSNSLDAIASAEYEVANTSKDWMLPEGDGEKTVYIQFKDLEGNESEVLSQKIYLDTTPPEKPIEVTHDGGDLVEEGSYVNITAKGTEKVKVYAVFCRENGTDLEDLYTIRLGYTGTEGEYYLYGNGIWVDERITDATCIKVYFEDFAGNKSLEEVIGLNIGAFADVTGQLMKPDGEVVPYYSVGLQQQKDGSYVHYRWISTDRQGYFTFDNIPNGNYRIVVYGSRGYKDIVQDVTVQEYNNVNVALTFEDKYTARGDLKVTVVDNLGNPVENAWINTYNWRISEYYGNRTDINGEVIFTNMPTDVTEPLTYYVSLYYNGYSEWQEVVINEGVNELTLEAPQITYIEGTVKDKDGNPLENVEIYTQGSNGQYSWIRTNADGSYRLSVIDDSSTTYEVRVYTNNLMLVPIENYNEVVPGTKDVNFTLYSGVRVYGKVIDESGNGIEANVYSHNKDSWEWHQATTNSNGEYDFGKVFGLGTHELYHNYISGYYSDEKEIEITTDDLINGTAVEAPDLVLRNINLSDIFTGSQNYVRTDVSTTQKGKNITVKVQYHNAGSTNVDNVTITANIPEGTELVQGSGQLTKTIDLLRPNEKGELSFIIKVNENYDDNKVVVSADAEFNGQKSVIGFAEVDIIDVTINGPEVDADGSFKLYGEATEGSKIMIMDKETGNVLASTETNGKWYSAEIEGLADGEYNLVAKAEKDGNVAISEPLNVSVDSTGGIEVVEIELTSLGGQKVGINEDTGVPAFSVWVDMNLRGRTIDAKVKLSKDVLADNVKFEFVGNEYEATLDNGFLTAEINDWSGSGTQQLKLKVFDGEKWITFIIGELTILIDPSGYVYDKNTGERIQGATVICEVKDGEEWKVWDAGSYGQINPQITDENGNYGWMVPDGEYRIRVQKDGYEPYVTTDDENPNISSIVIPPPRNDVNIGLINIQKPVVVNTVPEFDGTTALDAPIVVIFNKPMDTATINSDTFIVTDSQGNIITGTFDFTDNDTRVVFTPNTPFKHNETYDVVLTEVIKDKADRSGTQRNIDDYGFSFTADENKQVEFLDIVNINPADGATNVGTDAMVSAQFSKEVDQSTINENTFKVETETGERVLGNISISQDSKTVTFIPDVLGEGITYKIILESDIKSIYGDYLEEDTVFTFTTKTTQQDSGSSPGKDRDTDESSGLDTEMDEEPLVVTKKIDAEEGGKVVLEDVVEINVPAGALTEDANVNIEKLEDIEIDESLNRVSDIFELTTSIESRFNIPVEITFNYNKTKVNDLAKLAIYYYHEEREEWIYVGGSVDITDNTITASVDHFTKFGVFENPNLVKLTDMDNHWSREYVNKLVGMGIVNGVNVADNIYVYNPDDNVTRAQFAKLVALALDLDITEEVKLPFKDADKIQDWAKPYVAAVYKAGIIKGVTDIEGNVYFYPDKNITRAEMATMIGRGLKSNSSIELSFVDAEEIPQWAIEYIKVAVENKIIDGNPDKTFKPHDNATRGQAAKVIYMLLKSIGI